MKWRGKCLKAVGAFLFFAGGWMAACVGVQRQASERMAALEADQARKTAEIRQRIYGPNYFHEKRVLSESDKMLEGFDASGSKGVISLSYTGGLGGADARIEIHGDGRVVLMDHGAPRTIRTLDGGQLSGFFMKTITSGILNYSDAVIEVKCSLARPRTTRSVLDAPSTGFDIIIPELDIEKHIEVYAPRVELQNYPDIVEFQLVVALQEEILSFIPKDDPFRK